MKQNVSGPVAAILIVVAIAIGVFFIFRATGPRTDGPAQPVDMSKMMGGGNQVGPPKNAGNAGRPGGP
jgi:hypothetical protein